MAASFHVVENEENLPQRCNSRNSRRKRRSSHSSEQSQFSETVHPVNDSDTERLKRAKVILRFMLYKCSANELERFDQAKARLRFFYSPFAARKLHVCSSTCLFQDNFVRHYASGKRFLLMNKFRNDLLDNRWTELVKTSQEMLKFSYSNVRPCVRTLCYALMKPLTLSLDSEKLDVLGIIFKFLSSLPRGHPRSLQLELAHLFIALSDNEKALSTLRQKLQLGKGFYMAKDRVNEAEIFANDTVLSYLLNPNVRNAGKASKTLQSSDHWVAAPLAWRANLSENSADLNLVWHVIRGSSDFEFDKNTEAPSSCRLRYALSLADVLLNREKRKKTDGEVDISAQVADLFYFSPSDELLIYYSETNKLTPPNLMSVLFRMLDSPKLARNQKLWCRLSSIVVGSSSECCVEEIRGQWLENRDGWWPLYVEELSLPNASLELASTVIFALQNL